VTFIESLSFQEGFRLKNLLVFEIYAVISELGDCVKIFVQC